MRFEKLKNLFSIVRTRSARPWLWTALATIFVSAFLVFTTEVQEAASGEPEFITQVDLYASQTIGATRNPKLTSVAVDITALGSSTVLSLLVICTFTLLCFRRRWVDAIHCLIAAIGAGLITSLMKAHFERARPIGLAHLVEVQGYSYPSGHSLGAAAVYFTFAILLCHVFRKNIERAVILIFAITFICLIALSRIYLGVHYASDTIAGVLLGIGWASALATVSEVLWLKRRRNVI